MKSERKDHFFGGIEKKEGRKCPKQVVFDIVLPKHALVGVGNVF
jgi:hypothetical protein